MNMIDKFNQIISTFDEEKNQIEIDIIDSQIISAKKYLQIILNQNDKLRSAIDDLEFKIIEAEIEKNTIYEQIEEVQQKSKQDIPETSSFFEFLNAIDDQQNLILTEIESNKKTFNSLYHQKIKLTQTVESLTRLLESKSHQLTSLQNENRNLNDLIFDSLKKIDDKEVEYRETILNSVRFQKELEKKTNPLKNYDVQLDELKKERDQITKELQIKELHLKSMEKQIEQAEYERQKCIEKRKAQENQMLSVNTWKYKRSTLSTQLKKSKEEYYSLLSNINYQNKRNERISEKLKNILGEDEKGEGTSEIARKYLQAEINDLISTDDPIKNEEIMAEQDYNSQLLNELELIENSINTLHEQKLKIIQGLKGELSECSQDGYIRLLENEMKSIKTSLCQTIQC